MARKHKATGLAAFICFTIVAGRYFFLRSLRNTLLIATPGTSRDELDNLVGCGLRVRCLPEERDAVGEPRIVILGLRQDAQMPSPSPPMQSKTVALAPRDAVAGRADSHRDTVDQGQVGDRWRRALCANGEPAGRRDRHSRCGGRSGIRCRCMSVVPRAPTASLTSLVEKSLADPM